MNIFLLLAALTFTGCSKNTNSNNGEQPPAVNPDSAIVWLTKADQTVLLLQQPSVVFNATANSYSTITVDSTITYQTIDGFGYTLTGGSAQAINSLDATAKANLLQELFGSASNSVGISYLRISIGASDLNAEVFSYDDVAGDVNLEHFSLEKDKELIALLKEIVAINPSIKILATPWSPPAWMKDNNKSIGGSLYTKYYDVYAQYFVKYIQAMKAEGITVDAITPQNEPLHPGNNPSMLMLAGDQANFIKNSLGPAFAAANISTKIIIYDHNCDKPDYPMTVLNDADAAKYVDGSAFHLYAGDISALSTVHNAFPDKHVYFTEQWTSSEGQFAGDFLWHVKNVIVGSMNNWSRVALEWNLANDASFGPHTPGGCTQCKGALTINGSVTRNVAYYIIAQIAKFVPAGSVRINSNAIGGLYNVAFKTPEGRKVLFVLNDGASAVNFNIKFKDKTALASLPAGAAATYIW
ncbi:glycoside hydrolase family 30 protein [Parafilimonas sp.]|uniref:glycoside hydrolase family 30 protein n=1 Tax=Parafilimonas sp. TaxID=1969739 RepID=UPI003F80C624